MITKFQFNKFYKFGRDPFFYFCFRTVTPRFYWISEKVGPSNEISISMFCFSFSIAARQIIKPFARRVENQFYNAHGSIIDENGDEWETHDRTFYVKLYSDLYGIMHYRVGNLISGLPLKSKYIPLNPFKKKQSESRIQAQAAVCYHIPHVSK